MAIMSSPTTASSSATALEPRQASGIYVALAVLGVLVSFAYFIPATLELGFLGAWASAFSAPPFSVGLTWDLIFTDLIVFALAFADRQRIGRNGLAGTIIMGLTFGVCAALAVYAVASRRGMSANADMSSEDPGSSSY